MWESLSTVALLLAGTIIVLVVLCVPVLVVQLVRNLGYICLSLTESVVGVVGSAISTVLSSAATSKMAARVYDTICDTVPQIVSPQAWANTVFHTIQKFFGLTERIRAIFTPQVTDHITQAVPAQPRLTLHIPSMKKERRDSIISATSSVISNASSAFSNVSFSPRLHRCVYPTDNGRCLHKKYLWGFTGDFYCHQHKGKRRPGLDIVEEEPPEETEVKGKKPPEATEVKGEKPPEATEMKGEKLE